MIYDFVVENPGEREPSGVDVSALALCCAEAACARCDAGVPYSGTPRGGAVTVEKVCIVSADETNAL